MMIIITFNLICQAIFSGNGYTYDVSPNISSAVLQDPDCEKAWYRKAPGDGAVLEYLSDGNQSRHTLVVDVSEKSITITECIELRHNVTCHRSNLKFQHIYQVTDIPNATNSTIIANSPNTYFPHTTNIKLIPIIIPIIIIITIIIGIGVLFWKYRPGRRNSVLVRLRGCCKQTEEQNNKLIPGQSFQPALARPDPAPPYR
ncbi:uncharacterized protein LOC113650434 isoform X4 [Tachysurus fulvidraco]|uniref:uncharacterized protein LOC113650434 isoform X4 n=1 Tax=Tachysurus fulvidraco TaxID=1234273 RepID=UPI001FED8458|nr:uncharacterized protein LOC113650434 isoform X4 [Tachysurus fulvidraco]